MAMMHQSMFQGGADRDRKGGPGGDGDVGNYVKNIF